MNTSELRIKKNQTRRKQELRRRMVAGVLLLILTTASSLLFFSFRTKAQTSDDELLYKYYKSTIVKSGDTLWNFAGEYGESRYYDSKQDYIREVMLMNGLEDDQITEGQYIILPYYSPEFVS